jgi:hypothetical protein
MRLSSNTRVSRVCLSSQVGGVEAAEKPFLEERLATREANEKMVLEPLAYSSDTAQKCLSNQVGGVEVAEKPFPDEPRYG